MKPDAFEQRIAEQVERATNPLARYKPKHRIYCPICQRAKMVFETKHKAILFIRYNKDKFTIDGYKPRRAYYCVGCMGWHLTHRENLSAKKAHENNPTKTMPTLPNNLL